MYSIHDKTFDELRNSANAYVTLSYVGSVYPSIDGEIWLRCSKNELHA
jgi:hypothetical protein